MDIKNGVRGRAYVQSATIPTESGSSGNVKMWLDVYVEGWEPYRLQHHCMMKRTKHPSPGETLPVMVDPKNKERIDILWEEVKTVDEVMSEGQPGAAPGMAINVMGEPQVVNLDAGPDGVISAGDLSAAGLSPEAQAQVQQAMEMAQRMMGQIGQLGHLQGIGQPPIPDNLGAAADPPTGATAPQDPESSGQHGPGPPRQARAARQAARCRRPHRRGVRAREGASAGRG